jgi:hypothetical protein
VRSLIGILLAVVMISSAVAEEADEGGIKAKLGENIQKMQSVLVNACTDKQECLDNVLMLTKVIWENRDRRDLHKHLAVCSATIAYKKGYVLNPRKMWTEMNAELAKTTAIEVCECISDKWRNPSDVCHSFSKKLEPDLGTLKVAKDSIVDQAAE